LWHFGVIIASKSPSNFGLLSYDFSALKEGGHEMAEIISKILIACIIAVIIAACAAVILKMFR
jgi:hypothetical protein